MEIAHSRTRDLASEFHCAFYHADAVIVTEIYPAGETPIPGVTGEALAAGISGHGHRGVHYEADLEKVMLKFMNHEYDVLVSTTIIENGLDIPLCNTILINRADRLGLSELYQLRGRVGRSNRRAYAYLLIPKEVELTPIARRRLAAIRLQAVTVSG